MLIFSCLLLGLFQSPKFGVSVYFLLRIFAVIFLLFLSSFLFFFLHRCSLCYGTTSMSHIVSFVLYVMSLLTSVSLCFLYWLVIEIFNLRSYFVFCRLRLVLFCFYIPILLPSIDSLIQKYIFFFLLPHTLVLIVQCVYLDFLLRLLCVNCLYFLIL